MKANNVALNWAGMMSNDADTIIKLEGRLVQLLSKDNQIKEGVLFDSPSDADDFETLVLCLVRLENVKSTVLMKKNEQEGPA